MANEGYHEPIDELRDSTRDMHRAIVSLMEELEAVDWYNQRVDACKDPVLRSILAHNRDEEKEHAAMLMEWIRRTDSAAFYFDGADFWSRRGLDANGDFYFVLSLKGKTVYNGLTAKKGGRMLFTGAPTLLKPDYTGPIDLIAITFSGNGKDWNHLAFDNFRFRAIAP